MSETQANEQIAQRPGQLHPKAHTDKPLPIGNIAVIEHNDQRHNDRYDDKEQITILKQAESSARDLTEMARQMEEAVAQYWLA